MSNELVIDSTQEGCRIALLKDKNLVEFHRDEQENQFKVGDIYLGTVKKVVQGLNAAFIDLGYEKDAFLHYLDLGPQVNSLNKFTKQIQSKKITSHKLSNFKVEPDIDKFGKISQVLTKGKQILVQVVKEPISTKGPRLSCELSIAGRFIVLVPFSNTVNISKKITDNEERKRLIRLISSIKPDNFGVIIRTVAMGKDVADLDKDMRDSLKIWEEGVKSLKTAKPREKVIGEMSRASSMLRDMLNESFDSIVVDDTSMYNEIKSYIHRIAPDKEKIVKLYSGKAKIFENYGIEKQVKSLFGQSVSLKGGGYLIIEHTEALHVIDVNSGNKSNVETDQETTALNVNIQAAKEVARQLRLRDMGGIIVIDFIDMRRAENKKLLFETMKEEMKTERSKFTVLPLSKFGLMQITRQRVRPEMNIVTREKCPTCGGTGKISASILVSDQIERNLDFVMRKQNEKNITISLHPFLFAYFTKGLISIQVKWFFKYYNWIKLIQDSSLGLTSFKFYNRNGEEIEVENI
ncbi:Rne/Rng family ribonuclease [Xanthovirga aplysinae]|uniref:Rne/Rng family ribonuclease n=1 Tax=Xanthovirga aplysinae TaxID=2529853 RepID=UPI0012BB5ED1|nr:Rne/Rng family ribonuclease [Xanthovirga aplysinae]MTI29689.1 Rne/Rng family ribonuclease [Xanthovirga aplysinae]